MKKKEFASSLNKIKEKLSSSINQKFKEFQHLEINDRLKKEKVDITLPVENKVREKYIPFRK